MIRIISKILFVFLIPLQAGYAQTGNSIPSFIKEQIALYDSIAYYRKSDGFNSEFGVMKNVKIFHITGLRDSLIIYPLYKKNKIENLLIASVRGDVFMLNKKSVLTKGNVKNTPIQKYFKRFFKVLNVKLQEESNSRCWVVKKRCNRLFLKRNLGCDSFIWALAKARPKNILSNQIVHWGQENDGDFLGILKDLILKLVKERSPEGTTIEINQTVTGKDDSLPTFSSLFALVKHLDAMNIPDFVDTKTGFAAVPKELRDKLQLLCELRNSNNVTIDEFFANRKSKITRGYEGYINAFFLMDDKYMESYSLLLKKEIIDKPNSIESFQKLTSTYPVCFDVLPQIIKSIPHSKQ